MPTPSDDAAHPLDPEDAGRVALYRTLSRALAFPPNADALADLARLSGNDLPFGRALTALGEAAAATTPEAEERAHNALFIGIGRGELVPYGSFYLTGFLNEKPLARLRRDMGKLGIRRAEGVSEPEDHVAALCEMMAGLITGDYGAEAGGRPASHDRQRAFFDDHLGSWMDIFFTDLAESRHGAFHSAVGAVGHMFIGIEREAFRMAA